MTVNLSALAGAGQQFFNDSGVPLAGGKLYSYAAGTTTPQATYTSVSGSTAHTNPIILNSAGRVATGEIWLTAGENYKFSLFTSADVLIATYDNITGINGTGIATNASAVQYDPGVYSLLFPGGTISAENAFNQITDDEDGSSLIGFIQSGVSAVGRTTENKMRETVSVKDFGAVGDGAANDTAAITAAIAEAVSSGQTLHFQAGVYLVENITSDSFSMLAEQNAVLKLGAGGTFVLNITGGDSFKWENITFNGNNIASSVAYTTANVDGVAMNNVSVTGFADRCCVFQQSVTNVQIVGGTYSDNTGADTLVLKSNYNTITGCHFKDIPEHAVRFGRFSSDAAVDSGCYSTISNCTFDNVTNDPILCELGSKFVTIEGNEFFETRNICKITAATDDCFGISIVGNTLRKPKGVVSGFTRGVSATDSDQVTVIGNVINLTGSEVGGVATNANSGITLGTNALVSSNIIVGAAIDGINTAGNCAISNNSVSNFTTNGIVVNGENCCISNNIVTSSVDSVRGIRSSGANTSATGNRTVLTGATTIGFSGTSGATNATVVANNFLGVTTSVSVAGAGTINANNQV